MKELTENPSTATLATGPLDGLAGRNAPDPHDPPEVRTAKELARRYRLSFVDLLPTDQESPVNYELFNEIPVDLMVRHQFLPLKRDAKGLHLAMADPTDLERLDELAG